MRWMTVLIVFNVLLSSQDVASSTSPVPLHIRESAKKFHLDPILLYALCKVETGCKTTINHNDGTKRQKDLGITSKSYGMFQIKLATAKGLGFKGNYEKLMQPHVNSYYAAKYIRTVYDKYHDTLLVLSAYNAGKPIKSNKAYVDKVSRLYVKYKVDGRY
jgi:soluble lytic murein transglycosylase-like protein